MSPCWQWEKLGYGPGLPPLWICLSHFCIHPSTGSQAGERHSETTGSWVAPKGIRLWRRCTLWWQPCGCSPPLGNEAAWQRQYRHSRHLGEEAGECSAGVPHLACAAFSDVFGTPAIPFFFLPYSQYKQDCKNTPVILTCPNPVIPDLVACHLVTWRQCQRGSREVSQVSWGTSMSGVRSLGSRCTLAPYSLSFDLGQITSSLRACFLPVPPAHRSVVFSVVKCFKVPPTNVAATDWAHEQEWVFFPFFLFVLWGLGFMTVHSGSFVSPVSIVEGWWKARRTPVERQPWPSLQHLWLQSRGQVSEPRCG